jgi:hypothetical protein
MSEYFSPLRVDDPISRRSLLRGGAAAAALAALSSCDSAVSLVSASTLASAGGNVRVSRDRYRDHVGPSLAANPRHPRQLLVACQGSPRPPEFIATYLSFDGGASWQPGGRPPQPAAGPAGDDVNIAFDARGRGYICAARSGHGSGPTNPANPDANRAVYVWRTDDGGRNFSEPVTLVAGTYSDHPWLATGQGQTPHEHNVYVAWAPARRTRRSTLGAPPMAATPSNRRAGSWRRPAPHRWSAPARSSPADRTAWYVRPATGQASRTHPAT